MGKIYQDLNKYQALVQQSTKIYQDLNGGKNEIGGATYLGGKVVAGAASIGIGAYNLIAGAFDQLAGNTYAAEKRYHENSARAFSDKLDTMYEANGAMKFAGAVAEGVGQFIPTAVISLIPGVGVPLAQGIQFAGYTGMNVEDAYKKTGSLGGKEYAYGALMGGFETALEFVGGKVGGWIGGSKLGTSAINLGKGATKGISAAAAKGGKLAVANTVGGIVKGGATEFTEEFIEAFAEVGLQRMFQIDPSATVTLGEALYAGAVGFASGGLMSGTTSLINTQGMKSVGRRVIKAGEADATVAAAFEVASAFKSQGSTEAKVLQTLTDNLTLWEQTADKTGAQAQMILGNIELSMNVVAAMAASQGTIGTIMKNPEKFLPYAKAIFGEGVTLEDLKNADSRVVRYLAASNWATGEVDALTIRAKRRAFEQSIAAERGGEGILDLSQYSVGEGDTVHRAPDGSYVFTVHNKGDTYTVMHGSDLDHLSALEENGSTAMNEDGAMRAAAAIYTDTWQKAEARAKAEQTADGETHHAVTEEAPKDTENKTETKGEKTGESATEEKTATDGGETEENAAGEKNAGENGKKHVLSSELKRERERLIDRYGAEVQDKARKLLGKEVDTLSADRRIAIYEAISKGENVDVDILRAACYFMTKRAGLYVYFGQDLNEVIERETTEETDSEQSVKKRVRKNGLHKVLSAGARLVALDGSAKSLRKVLVHEIFHDIAPTKKGRKLMMTALEVSSAQRLYGISKLYGDHFAATYHERGVVSFEQFCKDSKYDVESKESVLSAIEAYEKKYEAVIGKNALVEEIAAEVVGHNLDSKRFMKMAKDTNAGGLILRGLRRMLTYLRTKKEARPLYLEAVRFENLYLDAVGESGTHEAMGDARFSIQYAPRLADKARDKLSTLKNTLTEEELELAIEHTAQMVEIMKQYEDILPEDKIGKTIVKNGSYDRSVENTTICVRTLAYNSFVDMVSEKIGRPLSQRESFLVSQKLYEIAKEPQCLYCYVSLDRKAYNEMLLRYIAERDAAVKAYKDAGSPEVTQSSQLYLDYLHGRKATPDQWKRYSAWVRMAKAGETMLSAEEIATEARRVGLAGGTESQRAQVADMLKYAQSASWAKKQTAYAAYNGDILKLGPKVIKDLNKHYGLRWYSFSDYSAAFIVENMQQITDAAVMGLKGLAYTKDTDFARIFAPTGMNINISVYAKYEGGRYVIDEKQSANLEEAIALREQYPNVGIVVVAADRQGVEWALEQTWSDVVIPFHIVRTGKDVADFYKWEVFNAEQNDTVESDDLWQAYVDSVTGPNATENARKKVSKMVYPSEHQNNRDTYLRICKERGLKPRFGSFVSNENYMKLVNETRQSEGNTKPLKPVFDVDSAKASFDKFVEKGGYFEGWYNDGIDVEAEAEIVAADVRAGKQANEVDYGRQDLDADALMKGRRVTREHGANTHYSLESYSYEMLTKKPDLTVLTLPASAPVDEKGNIDKKAVFARGRENAKAQNNPHNTEMKTYIRVDDIGVDVLLAKKGMEHGVARSEETALAIMKIGDILKNSFAVNELNGSEKRKTEMSYTLLGACRDNDNLYVVRTVVSKLKNDVTEIDIYQLGAVKGKKTETPTSALGGTAVTEQSSLIPSGFLTISIADFLEKVKTIPLANEVFSADVAKKLGVARNQGSLSGDIRYSLSYDEHELVPPKTSEGEKRKNIAHHTRAKSYKRIEAAEVVKVMFSSERFGAKGSILSMKGASKKAIIDYLWRQMNTTDPDKFDEIAERVADFMIRHTTLQEAFITPSDEMRFENARIALDVIPRFKGKINISDHARAELVYRFGGKNGRKKGEGDRLSDYWHQKDGNGMSVEMAAEAIETAIRDNGGYCNIVADTVQETIYNLSQFYGEALRDMEDYRAYMQKTSMEAESEADRDAFRAEIKEKIMDALRDKGKESRYHKVVQFYERENERLRDRLWESNKKYEGAVKMQYGAAHAVFLAREMADIVKKRKYVNAADVISPEMEAVGEILSKIATPRKIKDKDAREAMGLLARWYTPQNVDGDSATEQGEAAEGSLYHPEIKEKMERLAAGDKNAQLTYEELREMAQVLGAVRHVILNYGTVVLEGHRVQAAQLATDETSLLVSYLEKGEGKEGKGFLSSIFHNAGAAVGKKLKDNFLYKVMTPKQVIQSLEWFDKDGVLTRCFADMQNGMAGAGSDYADMMRPVIEFFDSHKKYEKRLSKEYISYEGEEMSVGQAISLYLTTKREQAARGFEEAGFRYMGKDGKVRQAAPRPAEAIRGEISAALSADDKAYIKVVEDVFARAGEMKKQTDLEIFGFTNVENGYYYPIARDQMEIARKVSDLRATLREMAVVGNKSFNKSTVKGAKNALFISDVTLVTDAHAMGVSQYANLYMPFSTWDRLWNKKVDDGKGGKISVRQLIGDRIWTGKNDRSMADGFFRQLFADMQGVRADKRTGDGFYETLRSTYVSASLGFNLSSILKQTGSFASAMVYLHPIDLAKGLGMNLKTDRAEMWKYSKVANARMFQRGRFVEQNANTKLDSMGKGVRKFGEMTMIGVEGMDNMVIGRLWNACQQNIARTKGLAVGTEQNKVEAGKLLDTVINETQSTSTADTRSALQRGGFIGKTLSMFSSDAVKQVSYLFEGAARVYCARLRRKMGKGSDAEVKAANVFLGRAVASFAASTALVVAITQFIKWLLGREREEDETIVEDVTHEAIGQVLGIIPLVSDVYGKVANNYDIDDFSFEAINGLLEGTVTLTSNVVKAANGEIVSRQEILKPLRTVIYQAGAFTGLPIRNFTNYTTGVLKKLSPKAGYSFDALFEKPSYTADISKAIERGDTKLAEYILELSVRERMGKGDYDSVVAAELLNLNLNGFAAPDDNVTPPSIPASVGDVAVNAAQYKQMQRIYNKASGALAEMVQSDSYLALSDEEKVDAVNRVYRTYLNLAKAEVMGADRTAAVWVSPLLSGESGAILAHIATMESDDESTRSEKVTDYLSTLDLDTEEKYLILFAAGYRSKAVLASVRKSMAKSDFSDELKKQFTEEYPEK